MKQQDVSIKRDKGSHGIHPKKWSQGLRHHGEGINDRCGIKPKQKQDTNNFTDITQEHACSSEKICKPPGKNDLGRDEKKKQNPRHVEKTGRDEVEQKKEQTDALHD